jgi:DNA repair protein SbcD/Mre11
LWADLWPLPGHVHRFPVGRVERIVHHRAGEPLVQILGTSARSQDVQHDARIHAADFVADSFIADSDLFAVAVAHGVADSEGLARRTIPYWALGGEHSRRSLLGGAVTAHYCGTPQGRAPDESGPHGCTLVQVDESRHIRTTFLPTDAVRYCHERITLDASTPREALPALLNERLAELLVDPFGPDLLLHWTVAGVQRSGGTGDLLAKLRGEHGAKHPAAWTVEIDLGTAQVAAERYEEETLLGEFLRSAKHCLEHPDERISLEDFLAERHLAGSLAPLASLNDPDLRRRVLADAAALGVELLSPVEERT